MVNRKKSILFLLLGVVGVGLFVVGLLWPSTQRSVSLLVILDTVRADHTSVCGYTRPTTPVLEKLVADGASVNCNAWAPGSWTLPSHASFFTGLEVPDHQAHLVDQKESEKEEGVRGIGPARGLSPDHLTIAEQRPAILVSANPVLGPASGLDQGFRHAYTGLKFGDMYADDFVTALEIALEKAEEGDLIVLNISDAHQPWTDIPEGLDWVPSRKALKYRERKKNGLWQRWHRGQTNVAQGKRIVDLYDYSIFCADKTLGKALDAIAKHGFVIGDFTITSDHGEHIGEDNLLGHGHYLTDGNQRVPIISSEPLPEGPINATLVYELALGKEPVIRPVRAVSYPHRAKSKWFKKEGLFNEIRARSVQPDVEWSTPSPIPEGDFGAFIERGVQSATATSDESDLQERLEALGYL